MPISSRCKSLICCCACTNNLTDKLIKKRLTDDHKYCGCRESNKQRTKMKTCDNDRTILVDEVFEALDYDFVNEGALEECVLEEPVRLIITLFLISFSVATQSLENLLT